MISKSLKIFLILISLALLIPLSACRDDLDLGKYDIGEGIARVQMTLDYMPVGTASLAPGSRAIPTDSLTDKFNPTVAPPGNGFDITQETADDVKLKLFIYSTTESVENALVRVVELNPSDYVITNPERTGADADPVGNGQPTETSDPTTGRITVNNLTLEYGKYYIYAVAYAADINAESAPNVTALRSIRRQWSANSYKANRELFGVVTLERQARPKLEENVPVIVNTSSVSLHCWLRRLVSKVTISFDGSALRENVFVYFRRATVHNIPVHCRLGLPNNEAEIDGNDDVLTNFEGNVESESGWQDSIPKSSSHYIQYYHRNPEHPTAKGDWEMHKLWPYVSAGNPTFATEDHEYDAKSLTFYENMQGVHSKPGKKQIVKDALSGKLEDNDREGIRYGTYIEVEAYYVSTAENNISEGKIFYRFMLGKNDTDDYNAQRNHHFKLTLHLRGNANEYDWHVDYKEDAPKILVPSPFYVSYLPNQEGHMDFKINAGRSWELIGVKSEIVASSWLPQEDGVEPDEYDHYAGAQNIYDNAAVGIDYNPTGKLGATPVPYKDIIPHLGDDGKEIIQTRTKFFGTKEYQRHLGFLSLRPIPYHTIVNNQSGTTATERKNDQTKVGEFLDMLEYANRDYLVPPTSSFGEFTDTKSYDPITSSKYSPLIDNTKLDSDGKYHDSYEYDHSLDADGNHNYSYKVPIYTSAKVLANGSTYSSYNPFVSSERHAYVRITATARHRTTGEEREVQEIVKVIQVPRLTNPVAIYRRHDNTDPFTVTLMRQNSRLADFTPIVSNGSWTAEIYRTYPDGHPWFSLSVAPGTTATRDANGAIHGKSGSSVSFVYKPDSECDSTVMRAGAIRIIYHNDNCEHYIYVRQGYASEPVVDNGTKWSCFNLYNKDKLCASPLSVGSYFKAGNLTRAIKESNNDLYGFGVTLVDIKRNTEDPQDAKPLWCTDDDINTYTWNEVAAPSYNVSKGEIFKNADLGVSGYVFPNIDNFQELQENCVTRFGIAYDDNSSGVATDHYAAHEFKDYDNDGKSDNPGNHGIRCVVLVNTEDGRNVLFPLSASAYARRKNYEDKYTLNGWRRIRSGRLRYATFSAANKNTSNRPLVYVNYKCFGGMYWYGTTGTLGQAAWDINYSDLFFSSFNHTVITEVDTGDSNKEDPELRAKSTDALPIRLIAK